MTMTTRLFNEFLGVYQARKDVGHVQEKSFFNKKNKINNNDDDDDDDDDTGSIVKRKMSL